MFHENKLPVIRRVAARKIDIARAPNLEDENESKGVIFRSGSSPASEATVQQAATVARTNAATQSLIEHLRALLTSVPHATSD